jgi:hypothetical protein
MEMEFFGGSGNGNATFSGGTDAEMEFPFLTDVQFSFYSCFLHGQSSRTLLNQTT